MALLPSSLMTLPLDHKRILLRFDGNIPLEQGNILDDYRLHALRPTLDFLLSKNCMIVLATHIGRPEQPSPQLSTQHLIPWFTKHGYKIALHPDLSPLPQSAPIILLENLRFFPGETTKDPSFSKILASFGEYYITEAFGTLHRDNASIVDVPLLFPQDKRTYGFLVHKEIEELSKLISTPAHPFAVLCGGGKVTDKIPLLENLINFADTLLLLPAIAHTFAYKLGKNIGKSLHDTPESVDALLTKARAHGTRILLPRDYQIAQGSLNGPLSWTTSDEIPSDSLGMSIGPKTIDYFTQEIHRAKTIFFNGIPGLLQRPETLEGAKALLASIAQAPGYSVIGGGDTVATARLFHLDTHIDFCSTGGGATLAYLSGKTLIGLTPFISSAT